MAARSKARKRALDVLFESEVRRLAVGGSLDDRRADAESPLNPYTVTIVEGVREHIGTIDKVIAQHARGWTLQRMPAVDRAVLRIGTFEILYADDVPDPVAINEAVDLAKELSTDESPRFVNGLLSAIAKAKAAGSLAEVPTAD